MAVADDELTSDQMSFQDLLAFEHVSGVECSRMPGDIDDGTLTQLEASLDAGLIEELGYSCSASVDHCKEILSLFPLSEASVAVILTTVSRTHSSLEDVQGAHSTFCSVLLGHGADSQVLVSWQIDVLVEAFSQLAPKLDWLEVYENFDHKSFIVPDQKAFSLLISLCSKDVSPLRAVCGRIWANTEGQLSFLKHAVVAPSDVCFFAGYRKQTFPETYQKFQPASLDSPWASLQLLEVLCRLAELGHANKVRDLLENPSKHFPEVLLPGLAQIKTDWNLIQTEYCPLLFAGYLTNSQNSSVVLHYLWSVNRDAVIRAVIEIYTHDSSTISRLLEICQQELKVLTSVLNGLPFGFSIELAALATRREYLNLEKWLNENLSKHRDAFFQACLLYLRDRVALTGQLGLPLDILSSFFKVLHLFSSNLSSRKLSEELKEIHTIAARYSPRLTSVGAEPLATEVFSGGIETEANSYFDKIFNGQLTIDDVIEMLQRFNASSIDRERDVCACMIRCLFDEYQFFPRYPDRELEITAVLFGKLIKHRLVTAITLGIALRGVLDALRKPLESKMFSFGMTALRQFTERLVELPQYCNHLLQISHLRDGHPDLFHFIERALQPQSSQPDAGGGPDQAQAAQFGGIENVQLQRVLNSSEVSKETVAGQSGMQPAVQAQEEERPRSAGSLTRSAQSTSSQLYDTQKGLKQVNQRPARASSVPVRHLASTPGFGHALNIETLVAAAERRDTPIENPSSEIEDKVGFIINNISANNVETKAKECLEIVEEQYFPWFAQYMVMKRASIEHNFHDVYLKFIDHINSKALDKEILKATYENCKVLLRSELIKSSSEERSLLKNLGSWLGKLTIGRNKCLRANQIDPKPLIIEAYEKGLMIAVIPFTSKILEPCKDSIVYRPPNPWTMSILNLLAEICTLPNLKMNLKFEVEVTFRGLGVELKDLKPTQLLKGRAREVEGNPDFATKDIVPPTEQPVVNHADFLPPELAASTTHTAATVTTSQHVPPTAPQDDEKAYENFPPFVDRTSAKPSTQTVGFSPHLNANLISPSQKLVGVNQQQLQRLIPAAMERAIREIITPVVDRSVTIACMTTRELIMKDFALESDDNRTMHSANLMVASLAGRLAHVTCKEPLRVAMANQIRQFLQALNVSSEYLDQAVHFVTNENLERGCEVIEKSATDKALRELEDALGPLLAVRRNQREVLLAAYAQGGVGRLPEALRPKPGRLSPGQQRVFEDFAALSWQGQASQPPSQTVHSAAAPPAPSGSPVSRLSYATGRGGLGAFGSQTASTVAEVDVGPDGLEARTPSPSFADGTGRQNEVVAETGPSVAPPEVLTVEGTPNKLVGTSPSLPLEHEQSALEPAGVRDDIRREPDPTGLREQAQTLFDDWVRLHASNDKAYDGFMTQLLQKGILKGDDVTDRFFRFLTELAIARWHLTDASQGGSFAPVDMYATLVVRLVKYFAVDPVVSKVNLLNRVLNATVRVIQKDADEKKTAFQSRPYYRLFISWFMDFNSPDPPMDSSNFQVLAAFGTALLSLQPLRVPSMSFVWLELISHRMFMPKQLLSPSQKGWPLFQKLLVALFKFMDPYLRNAELTDSVRLLYRGTLRVLLVLLHDFPEFLCEYHFSFCDVIPPSCIQMRNLILSAFPRNMRLPDPFTPNLKVDLLPEIRQPPRILSDVEGALKGKQLKAEVDEYIKKTRQGLPVLLVDLKARLLLPQQEALTSGTRYNVPLINSLVLYVGMQGIQQMQIKTTTQQLAAPSSNITESASMDIFKRLMSDLDTEGRYLFLNAIANQLRYPNNHTHYFSCVLLFLFAEAGQEIIQEQITRVLLERLIVNRPHPWGLLITFIELIKNTRYSFWKHGFVRCAPEIERLFDSVARSCMGNPKPMEEDLGAGVPAEAIKG